MFEKFLIPGSQKRPQFWMIQIPYLENSSWWKPFLMVDLDIQGEVFGKHSGRCWCAHDVVQILSVGTPGTWKPLLSLPAFCVLPRRLLLAYPILYSIHVCYFFTYIYLGLLWPLYWKVFQNKWDPDTESMILEKRAYLPVGACFSTYSGYRALHHKSGRQ